MKSIYRYLLLSVSLLFIPLAGVAQSRDPWVTHAIEVIQTTYGVRVSMEKKNKDLLKFGHNADLETATGTLMTLPDGVDNETYVSTNIITQISSTSGSDTEVIVVEGHTVAAGIFSFVSQSVTLTGQTLATLSTPLARVTRAYANGSTDLIGVIYVTQTDTLTAGVPDTAAKVHLMIRAGKNQSEKCATTLSSTDYWVITGFYCDMLTKSSSFAEVGLEIRLAGKVFRQSATVSCSNAHRSYQEFTPYIIAPANSDIRLRGVSDSGTGRDVAGGIEGVLLTTE